MPFASFFLSLNTAGDVPAFFTVADPVVTFVSLAPFISDTVSTTLPGLVTVTLAVMVRFAADHRAPAIRVVGVATLVPVPDGVATGVAAPPPPEPPALLLRVELALPCGAESCARGSREPRWERHRGDPLGVEVDAAGELPCVVDGGP